MRTAWEWNEGSDYARITTDMHLGVWSFGLEWKVGKNNGGFAPYAILRKWHGYKTEKMAIEAAKISLMNILSTQTPNALRNKICGLSQDFTTKTPKQFTLFDS